MPLPDAAEEEEDMAEQKSFLTDHARVRRIHYLNVAFSFATPSQKQLLIFDDAECFHRKPVTVQAVHDLQQQRRRPITRFVFD